MINSGRFFVPGPTEVRPEVLDAMRRPMIFHRNAEMEALMTRSTGTLGKIFGTKRAVHTLTGSGTSAMEMAIRNGTKKRVLSIVHGDFGERFARLAEACGREVTRLNATPGDVVPLDQVRDALRKGGYDAVLATHSETALGVLADIAGVAKIVREHDDVLLLVDGVSSVGATATRFDELGLDACVTASQKSMALPPGLAFAAVSERFIARAKTLKDRGAYLDILKYEEFTAKHQSPTTPSISLLYALDRQLQDVEAETVAGRFARHDAMLAACSNWADEKAASLGLTPMTKAKVRSPSVTCFKTDRTTAEVLGLMRKEGFELGGGQPPFTANTFRLGHMGDHTVEGTLGALAALERVLRR